MKQTILILLLLISSRLFAPADLSIVLLKPKAVNPFTSLWVATCQVESCNNPDTINFNENAYGIAQIRQIRIDDYNFRTGNDYCLYDCLDSAFSAQVYMFYASMYEPSDLETIARAWNGSGEMTKQYWNKIKKFL